MLKLNYETRNLTTNRRTENPQELYVKNCLDAKNLIRDMNAETDQYTVYNILSVEEYEGIDMDELTEINYYGTVHYWKQ